MLHEFFDQKRIQGALSNLGHTIGRTTIAEILRRHGIEPAPERSRKTTWKEFLSRHWELIVAADFFTVEVWTGRGLQRFLVLFFIELAPTQGRDGRDRVDRDGLVDEPDRQESHGCERPHPAPQAISYL